MPSIRPVMLALAIVATSAFAFTQVPSVFAEGPSKPFSPAPEAKQRQPAPVTTTSNRLARPAGEALATAGQTVVVKPAKAVVNFVRGRIEKNRQAEREFNQRQQQQTQQQSSCTRMYNAAPRPSPGGDPRQHVSTTASLVGWMIGLQFIC